MPVEERDVMYAEPIPALRFFAPVPANLRPLFDTSDRASGRNALHLHHYRDFRGSHSPRSFHNSVRTSIQSSQVPVRVPMPESPREIVLRMSYESLLLQRAQPVSGIVRGSALFFRCPVTHLARHD